MNFIKCTLTTLLLVVSINASAATIGVYGGNFNVWNSYLTNSGDTAVALSASSVASDYAGLDQVWLIRQSGSNNLIDYVNNGGTLVTEWSGSAWALNSASLLDATDTQIGYVGTDTSITFTQSGLDLGLGNNTGSPYSNGSSTEYFRSFSNIGSSVDVIATIAGYNVGVAGQYGNGLVTALGWDWQDVGYGNVITQLLVDDITNINVSTVPLPAAAWLFGSALLGFFGFSRRKAKA